MTRVPVVGAAGATASFAGMVVTALARPAGTARRRAAAVVIGGLAATTFDRLRARWGPARAVTSAVGVVTLGWSAEAVGLRTGRPFGRYSYTGRLHPNLGGVPVLVPLAWFAMAAPAREAAHAALGTRTSPIRRIVLGSAALTAWDLFLDPQMTAEGYWRWARQGRYRGIPATNFAGWLLVGAAAMAVLEAIAPPDGPGGDDPDIGLIGEYAGVAAMQTLGFAAFFRDRTVALVGGAAMVPIAAAALRRVGLRRVGLRRVGLRRVGLRRVVGVSG